MHHDMRVFEVRFLDIADRLLAEYTVKAASLAAAKRNLCDVRGAFGVRLTAAKVRWRETGTTAGY